jgi:hypothetical protein
LIIRAEKVPAAEADMAVLAAQVVAEVMADMAVPAADPETDRKE